MRQQRLSFQLIKFDNCDLHKLSSCGGYVHLATK